MNKKQPYYYTHPNIFPKKTIIIINTNKTEI